MVSFTGASASLSPYATDIDRDTTKSGTVAPTLSTGTTTRGPKAPFTQTTTSVDSISGGRDPKQPHPGTETTTLDVDLGLVIPDDFIGVDIVVRNADGELMPEVDYVMARGKSAIPASINDNARGTILLLADTYSEFTAIKDYPENPDLNLALQSTDDTKNLNPLTIDTTVEHEVTINDADMGVVKPGDEVVLLSEVLASSSDGNVGIGDDVSLVG